MKSQIIDDAILVNKIVVILSTLVLLAYLYLWVFVYPNTMSAEKSNILTTNSERKQNEPIPKTHTRTK